MPDLRDTRRKVKIALAALATLGEVADVLREEFGVYQAS